MQLRKQPHTPYWRDPKHRPERGLAKSLLAILSMVATLMLFVRPEHGYDEPISVQLSHNEPAAWICFIFMIVALGYFGQKLWSKEHYIGTIACVGMCGCLAAVAATNPYSDTHLGAFAILVLIMGSLHWGLYWTHDNAKLFALALAATAAVFICPFSLGIGERLLVLASTASINVVFYEHISY